MGDDTESALSYFDRLAPEYDRAFRLEARTPLNALVNKLFRGPTFRRRMALLEGLFRGLQLADKRVLDLGCGSGQVSLLAAAHGARVRAIDIAPRMIDIARASADRAGLGGRIEFECGDIAGVPLAEADVTLLIGVIEYYADFAPLIARAAAVTRQAVVVAHTNRVAYRMLLRKLLFKLDESNLYFQPMSDVIAAARDHGLRLHSEHPEHAFTILVFEPVG